VRFSNGKDISIQQLNSGVTAVVVQLLEKTPVQTPVSAFEQA
jgi:hypothetical protein